MSDISDWQHQRIIKQAVVLDLVQPQAAVRQSCGFYRKARREWQVARFDRLEVFVNDNDERLLDERR